ncbi:mismatch-specific DNA-glycosylase [Pseudoroseomonas cervicalis]|uniref:mismatch-specific DNA-glycosylase n=1 Tax=Teichococcus cervicalis TaxID=204525 RepID=UPI002782C41E|nr:mismatch-specific DNA-glycosylase [Pseudoroseomonas cervicalis]MDQ1078854.1 TDG/mug DNA glycosylase family protein [Pseudoroseomonas cervicalis]
MLPPDPTHILPDLLEPGLRLVFCGSAPSKRAAAVGAYYAHPGNKFWRILASAGLTERQLQPSEFRTLLRYRIGLTDMAKHSFGNDSELPPGAYDPVGFEARIRAVRPRAVAFTAKAPAAAFLRTRTASLSYGPHPGPPGFPEIWILPSTSGLATSFWDERPWHALGAWFRAEPPPPQPLEGPA